MNDFVASLKLQGIKAIVFDFDCTITIKHSGGRIRAEKMEAFLQDNISECFKKLLPKLIDSDLKIGVATFADAYKSPTTHIAGEALVRRFFKHHFNDEMTDKIQIVAAYPENYQSEAGYKSIGLSSPMPLSKEHHLGLLCGMWQLPNSAVALVDDDLKNVDAAFKDGHPTRYVKLRKGLMPEDMDTQFPQ